MIGFIRYKAGKGKIEVMSTKRISLWIVLISLLATSMAFAQYEDEPYIEGYLGANFTSPMSYIKNDLEPDSLNAEAGVGSISVLGITLPARLSVVYILTSKIWVPRIWN